MCNGERRQIVKFIPSGSVVVITGGAGAIGRALALEAARRGASVIVVCDVDQAGAEDVVSELAVSSGVVSQAMQTDVASESDVLAVLTATEQRFGPIDLWCSNAGVKRGLGLGDADDWQQSLGVNVMGHVHMSRYVVPRMVARGHGHVVITSSAAGLLSAPESAPYTVTKHASVALAEWLAITHGDDGLGVACVCPQAVGQPMNAGVADAVVELAAGALAPEQVARDVFDGIAHETFLILPHPEVAKYEVRRATDRERWLAGMRRVMSRAAAVPATDR
jgi:NAD(P)-dependent dehydrogenase (short-subunit alcohol dehydrogenase family)